MNRRSVVYCNDRGPFHDRIDEGGRTVWRSENFDARTAVNGNALVSG